MCMRKQAEIEQLKKTINEKTQSFEQLKRTTMVQQQPRTSQIVKTNNYVIGKKASISTTMNGPTKENNPATHVGTADLVAEPIVSESAKMHIVQRPQSSLKPHLQEAYNQLQKEIRGKTEAAKKRTDSFHCVDKKKANATINPYITQAPAWIDAVVDGSANNNIVEKERPSSKLAKAPSNPAKANSKSTISAEERVHMRSSSHSKQIIVLISIK